MKKTLYLLLLVFSLIALAGCQDEMDQKYSFTLELTNLTGEKLVNKEIEFKEGSEKTTLELIEDNLKIDYQVFDFGVMVNGIEDHYPKEYGASYNYFYEIQVDGIKTTSGISAIEYKDGMILSFVETSTLSEFDQSVDDFIYSFIENNLTAYLSDDYVDYMVLASLDQLKTGKYINLSFSDYYVYDNLDIKDANLEEMSIGDLLKVGVVYKVENKDLTSYKTELLKRTVSDPYSASSYLEALMLAGEKNNAVSTSLFNEVIADPDLAGMSLLALATYKDLEGFNTYLTTTTNYIKTTLTKTGIESWGTSNAASTAAVILGLTAHGINPQDEAYQTGGVGLVEALMGYQMEYGFKWSLADSKTDASFSTPQGFAALVAYKLSRDVWGFPGHNILDLN